MILTRAVLRYMLLPFAAFVASLIGTLAVRSQQPATSAGETSPAVRWLGLSAEQAREVQAHDAGFDAELNALKLAQEDSRRLLAEELQREGVTDEELRMRFEAVITAHNALERRGLDHLLAVRSHLTPDQQRKLLQLCAEGVREQGNYRWRHGRGAGGPPADESQEGGGRGRGRGKGGGH